MNRENVKALIRKYNGDKALASQSILKLTGLMGHDGQKRTDRHGVRVLSEVRDSKGRTIERIEPSQFSLRGLAEAFIGERETEDLLRNPGKFTQMIAQGRLLEEAAGGILPSQFANINAFTAATAGLMEISILEGWTNPKYIGDILAPSEDTKMFEGRKVIGVARMGDVAQTREPGMPTRRAVFGERWIEQPRTVENSAAVELTAEAVWLDLTGEVMKQANEVGDWLQYRKELRIIDAFIGVTNTYVYKGTSYNTYLSASTWDNTVTSNALDYQQNIVNAEIKFRDMKDQETNTRVQVNPDTILVQREYAHIAHILLNTEESEYRSVPGSTSTDQSIRRGPNMHKGRYKIIESPLVFERINAADGLNISAANSAKYWWMFEKGGFMKYVQNWPLTVEKANEGSYDMVDRGIVLFVKAHERGIPMIYEPRKVVRCTG